MHDHVSNIGQSGLRLKLHTLCSRQTHGNSRPSDIVTEVVGIAPRYTADVGSRTMMGRCRGAATGGQAATWARRRCRVMRYNVVCPANLP